MRDKVFDQIHQAVIAKRDGAHVAALFSYRNAIEAANYETGSARILYHAVLYAEQLKKELDREAVILWAQSTLERIPADNLTEIVSREIEELKREGKNATA